MANLSRLRYVVVLNYRAGELGACASFDDIRDAMEYADIKAALYEEREYPGITPGCVTRYEVIDTREVVDGWESKYETSSFIINN